MSKDIIEFFDLPQCITADYYDSITAFTREAIWQLCYRDLTHHKIKIESETELSGLCFNSQTVFPPVYREMADRVMQKGKQNLLNTSGFTGKGVKVAVIDRPINKNHIEFSGRIEYIEVIPDHPYNDYPDFHGMTCAGFLSGSTCGVAPESELVYFAIPNKTDDHEAYYEFQLEALKRIIEYNRNCNSPVRVVSLSAPFEKNQLTQRKELAEKLLSTGCVLIDATAFNLDFQGIDVFEKNGETIYELNRWQVENYERNKNRPEFIDYFNSLCFVPSTRRTAPGNDTDTEYIHWSRSVSESWTIPHISGAYACCLQKEPTLQFVEFIKRSKRCSRQGDYLLFDFKAVADERWIERHGGA